jgi:triosephosphate isomerase
MSVARPLIGTSWKMNLTPSEADAWFSAFLPLADDLRDIDLFVLPPFTAIECARSRLSGTPIAWGAQDVHPADGGAHTGDISAPMLADLGCRYVEVGHSERRRDHGERPELIAAKVAAILRWGMRPLLCTGEAERQPVASVVSMIERDLGAILANVGADRLSDVVIAYEPWWAIGVGSEPASPYHVGEVQRAIGQWVAERTDAPVPVLYGGSVDVASAPGLLAEPGVDGLFVGRSALDPLNFARIAAAAKATISGGVG